MDTISIVSLDREKVLTIERCKKTGVDGVAFKAIVVVTSYILTVIELLCS